jgi:Tol biopolymer transport system component
MTRGDLNRRGKTARRRHAKSLGVLNRLSVSLAWTLCAAFAVSLIAGCGDARDEDGGPTPVDRGIVFSSARDGDFEIYVMDSDGNNVRQLTINETEGVVEADDGSPSWSPDRRHIVFLSTRDHEGDGLASEEVYVMSADGSGQARLTDDEAGEAGPSWAPDGETLLFARISTDAQAAQAPRFELVRMKPDGTDAETLFEPDLYLVASAAWSPDGSRLAFTGCQIETRQLDCEIWAADADGEGAKKLTDAAGGSGSPAWSPNGEEIAFSSDRDMNGDCFFHDCTGWNGEIYVMNSDGSDQRRITDDPGDDGSPTWSPDGKRIAFSALRDVQGGVDDPNENYEIYVMDADGDNVVRLTKNTRWDWAPDW